MIKIGAANGSFDGERCFDSRDWTIRVHQPENWGALQSVKLADGTSLSFTAIEQDANAMPFAGEGGSPDGIVYEIKLSGAVDTEQVLKLGFADPADPAIPDLEYDEKIEQVEEPVEPAIKRTIAITEEMPANADLTEAGTIDWLHSGSVTAGLEDRKAGVEPMISLQVNGSPSRLNDFATKFAWSDGTANAAMDPTASGSYVWSGSFDITAKSGPDKRTLTLYFGGWQSSGQLEIYDEKEDFITDVYQFENMDASYYRKVTIDMQSEDTSTLKIKWRQTGGTGNVTFCAATLGEYAFIPDPPEPEKIEVTDTMPGSYNLTDNGTIDWLHVGAANAQSFNRKAGVETPQLDLTMSAPQILRLGDYKTAFNFSDGTPTAAVSGNRGGIYLQGSGERYFELTAQASAEERELTFFIGGWKSTGVLEIFEGGAEEPVYTDTFSNPDESFYRKVTVRYESEDGTPLRVRYSTTAGGNITFTGAALSTVKSTELKPGDVSGDNVVNIRDLIQIKTYILGSTQLTDRQRRAADINGDGRVNIFDLLQIKLMILNGEW